MIQLQSILRRSLRIGERSFSSTKLLQQKSPLTFGSISQQYDNVTSNSITNSTTTQDKKKVIEQVVKYKIHGQFTKNNTILTLSSVVEDINFEKNNSHLSFNDKVLYYINRPEKTLINVSTGNVGFRKWQRGEYEAAHKTAARLFEMMEDRGYLGKKIELVFKDFGKGRKAFEDALLGKPGNTVRQYISRISDDTKIKFGGDRSPKPRRL